MDLMKLPSILMRWRYVFAVIVGAAVIGLGIRLATNSSNYEATVALQISAPSANNVQLLGTSGGASSTLRDDLLLVSNDFTFVAESPEVHDLTVQRLNLQGSDANYKLTVKPVTDSSYLDLTVQARTPQLARAIATTHAQEAIHYYGELRAKPANTTAALLDSQIQETSATIASLQSSGSGLGGQNPNSAALAQALANYQSLLGKRSDALLAAQDATRVSFIQIVDAAPDATPASWLKTVGVTVALTLIGSLGLATLVTLLLESLYPTTEGQLSRFRRPVPGAASRGVASAADLNSAAEPVDNFRGKPLRSRGSG
jgi:uncharacterized protein involved in exopolysaccharide biosynthesis